MDNLLARIETQVATNWKLSESTLRLRRSNDLLLVLSHVFYTLINTELCLTFVYGRRVKQRNSLGNSFP